MKKQFNNKKNKDAAHSSLDIAKRIAFGLSTISSAVAVWAVMIGIFGVEPASIFSIAFAAMSFGICYIVDFFGVSKAGKYFFTEVTAIASRSFAAFTVLRMIAFTLWGIVFAGFFAISFFTSYYGSSIVKSVATPKADVKSIADISDKRMAAEKEAAAPYEAKRQKIEDAKAAELASAGSPELRKQAKKGDTWANNELNKLKAGIARKYDKRIEQIDKEEAKSKEGFAKRQDALDSAQLKALQAEIDGLDAQGNAIAILALAFGVAPLIIGGLLTGIDAVSEVADKAESSERYEEQQAEQGKQRHSSSSYSQNSYASNSYDKRGNF